MKSKIIFCLNFLWASVIAFSFPLCFDLIHMNITGHSKGYDYDLGSEKDISKRQAPERTCLNIRLKHIPYNYIYLYGI
jgi:hypothetical protein